MQEDNSSLYCDIMKSYPLINFKGNVINVEKISDEEFQKLCDEINNETERLKKQNEKDEKIVAALHTLNNSFEEAIKKESEDKKAVKTLSQIAII